VTAFLAFFKLIPWWVYALIAVVGYHFAAIHFAIAGQKQEDDARWNKQIAEEQAAYQKQIAELKIKQQTAVTQTVIEYRDRVKVVKEKGDEIIKYVDRVIPVNTPDLPGGMRLAHDAAARGELPNDSTGAASSAPAVAASTYAETVAANYEICRSNAEELTALQKLVSQLEVSK
jgi:hypothetical protein